MPSTTKSTSLPTLSTLPEQGLGGVVIGVEGSVVLGAIVVLGGIVVLGLPIIN